MIFDTVMINDEFDMLECRLTELQGIPNLVTICVEADVDHQGHPKPYAVSDNLDRFAPWAERLHVVRASGLPTVADDPDPWAREHAQREYTFEGLRELGASATDVVFHGDVDEIPTAVTARNIRPRGFMAFDQTLYCFAVDWQHPERWRGTVAGTVAKIESFGYMRDCRNVAPAIPNGGWHLSWLGGKDQNLKKLGSFCHPEIAGRALDGIESGQWLDQGWHVDGKKLSPVDVDETWPRWIAEGNAPASWFRRRGVESNAWQPPRSAADVH